MQKWEYTAALRKLNHETDMLVEEDIIPIVSNHGMGGWELVSVQNVTVDGKVMGVVYYFKRPVE